MDFIRSPLSKTAAEMAPRSRVSIIVDRREMEKRLWRGVVGDGREFGFDLEHPLRHGLVFFATDTQYYVILQQPEKVLEVDLGDATTAARIGWKIGNLHLPIQVEPGIARVIDDLSVRRMLDREGIAYRETKAVFEPMKGIPHAH